MERRLTIWGPDIARGLRAGLATVLPFHLALVLERPELAWMALGGWLASLADPGGARAHRGRWQLGFAAVGGLLIAVGQGCAERPLLGALFGVGVAFATSLARALGGSAGQVGTMLLVGTSIALGRTGGDPLTAGLLFALGASWALALSTVVWPIWSHRPLERALARIHEALAAYLDALATADATTDRGELARRFQRPVRAAIEEAREVAVALRSRRQGESTQGSRLRTLLGIAEQDLFAVVALGEELATEPTSPERERLPALAAVHRRLHDALLGIAPAGVPAAPTSAEEAGSMGLAERLEGSALLQTRLLGPASEQAVELPSSQPLDDPGAPQRGLQPLRDALSLDSPHLRHAARVAVAVAFASLLARWLSPAHVSWLTVTTIGVLQPYPGATLGRAVGRVVGTALGSVVAVALMQGIHTPVALSLSLLPLSVAAQLSRPRSYPLFSFFLTPVFVLFADRLAADPAIALARVGDAVVGGLVAALAAGLLWPDWERVRLGESLLAGRQALRRYLAEMAAALVSGRSEERGLSVVAARRAVGVALGEAEGSLERMLAEPRDQQAGAARALAELTYLRRFSNALTSLDLRLIATREQLPAAAVEPLVAQLDAVLAGESATAPELARPFEGSGVAPALRRLVGQAQLLASEAQRR